MNSQKELSSAGRRRPAVIAFLRAHKKRQNKALVKTAARSLKSPHAARKD
jgi:hypothetical protein